MNEQKRRFLGEVHEALSVQIEGGAVKGEIEVPLALTAELEEASVRVRVSVPRLRVFFEFGAVLHETFEGGGGRALAHFVDEMTVRERARG